LSITPQDVFAFEHGYIWGFSGRDPIASANLWMLYPGAEPKNRHNQEQFRAADRAGGRLVTFQILPAATAAAQLRAVVEMAAPSTRPIAHGADPQPVGAARDHDYFRAGAGADPAPYIVCRSQGPRYPSPGCTKYAVLSDRLTISFNFSRRRLAEWKSIQSELITLVQSKRIHNPSSSH
jgi:hypothetical protein